MSGIDLSVIREQAKVELETLSKRRQELEQVLRALGDVMRPPVDRVASFKGWTIPAAAKQVILEAGCPLTTRQVLDALEARGWTTTSGRPITVIHSGLADSPYIKRFGKKWDVSEKGLETAL